MPAEPVGVAQLATRRMQARIPLVRVVCARSRRGQDRVVVASPVLDDDCASPLSSSSAHREGGVEALDVAVLPGAAALDVGGLGSRDPSLQQAMVEGRARCDTDAPAARLWSNQHAQG